MTTDTQPHTEGTDPVFAEKPEQTDIELDDIYPNKDLEQVKEKEEQVYQTGDWE